MRVFVVGTGRCGTVTFSKACRHISNYTSAHERMAQQPAVANRLKIPDNHIEVDPHLFYYLASIIQKYPDALFIHLTRDVDKVTRSQIRRPSTRTRGIGPLVSVCLQQNYWKMNDSHRREAIKFLVSSTIDNIRAILKTADNVAEVCIDDLHEWFPSFWKSIDAEGDLERAVAECKIKHNAS